LSTHPARLGPVRLTVYSQVSFDLVGLSFGDHFGAGLRSAASRSDKLSFLREITPEELNTYTPAQVAIILEQRHHVGLH
jgi:hypothetical protein